MEKRLSLSFAAACLLGMLAACELRDTASHPPLPLVLNLEGRWHYDSVVSVFYGPAGRPSAPVNEPIPTHAWLTVGPTQWRYSGTVREEHTYVRRGNRVWLTRIADTALVNSGLARPQDLGHALPGPPVPFVLTTLTPSRFVACDSIRDPEGVLKRVWCFYYSR